MADNNQSRLKNIEVSAGLLVGYLIAGSINMLVFDKTWQMAFSDYKLITAILGIGFALIVYKIAKNKAKD